MTGTRWLRSSSTRRGGTYTVVGEAPGTEDNPIRYRLALDPDLPSDAGALPEVIAGSGALRDPSRWTPAE